MMWFRCGTRMPPAGRHGGLRPLVSIATMFVAGHKGDKDSSWVASSRTLDSAYLFFHPPRCPGAPPDERGDGPNSGPDSREFFGWKILLSGPGPIKCGGSRAGK